ncbi:hypothetical protein F4801DRAFT_572736 [Xylaria longipes]|nr:hypothetical protein F4801DRAFT_572736 [Xylaria longipes]
MHFQQATPQALLAQVNLQASAIDPKARNRPHLVMITLVAALVSLPVLQLVAETSGLSPLLSTCLSLLVVSLAVMVGAVKVLSLIHMLTLIIDEGLVL